jgi:hypothetical protein
MGPDRFPTSPLCIARSPAPGPSIPRRVEDRCCAARPDAARHSSSRRS